MHQLVLQFAANTIRDYDDLVALEQQLIATLGDGAVDGHDMGSGEANIFILTSDPQNTFQRLAPVLQRTGHLADVTAAYRATGADHYHVLWPANSSRQFSVA
jgi:3-hydroxyisobutyrate dehydrogenase-like beta-hydroxyacid dehydrogenase